MPSEMDDIELKSIQLHETVSRCLSKEGSSVILDEEKVETSFGSLLVAIQGDRLKPAMLTFHDIGLNSVSNFQGFFNYIDMQSLIKNFCVYHINAPGQEEGAPSLPDNYIYPPMEQLGEAIAQIMDHFGIKHAIGFGVGAGGNILSRMALAYPDRIDALILVNCSSRTSTWTEWGYQKVNAMYLRGKVMTSFSQEYLLWHHFGRVTMEQNQDLVNVYREYFEKSVNPFNLALFIESYIKRSDLCISRELIPEKKKANRTLKCPVIQIIGASSPHVDESVEMNGRLDPANSNWLKVSDCGGMVLEEQPSKVLEAIRLFLQGCGYALNDRKMSMELVNSLSKLKLMASRSQSFEDSSIIRRSSVSSADSTAPSSPLV